MHVAPLPGNGPLGERNLEVAKVQQLADERLVRERVDRWDWRPRTGRALAIPHPQQLALDPSVGRVRHAVAVQVAASAGVPDLQLGRVAELQSRRLERHADI